MSANIRPERSREDVQRDELRKLDRGPIERHNQPNLSGLSFNTYDPVTDGDRRRRHVRRLFWPVIKWAVKLRRIV